MPNTQNTKITFTQQQLQQIYQLDTLGLHGVSYDDQTNTYSIAKPLEYPIGEYPTEFACEGCGEILTLKELHYNPYTKKHYCKNCK